MNIHWSTILGVATMVATTIWTRDECLRSKPQFPATPTTKPCAKYVDGPLRWTTTTQPPHTLLTPQSPNQRVPSWVAEDPPHFATTHIPSMQPTHTPHIP